MLKFRFRGRKLPLTHTNLPVISWILSDMFKSHRKFIRNSWYYWACQIRLQFPPLFSKRCNFLAIYLSESCKSADNGENLN